MSRRALDLMSPAACSGSRSMRDATGGFRRRGSPFARKKFCGPVQGGRDVPVRWMGDWAECSSLPTIVLFCQKIVSV